jgi:Zn-dependent protease
VAANVALALACGALLILTGFAIHLLCPGERLPELGNPFAPITADWLPGGAVTAVWIEVLKSGILINLILASLNLLPIPPLDGAHLFRTILPKRVSETYAKLGVIGLPLLLVLVLTDSLFYVFLPGALIALVLSALPAALFSL